MNAMRCCNQRGRSLVKIILNGTRRGFAGFCAETYLSLPSIAACPPPSPRTSELPIGSGRKQLPLQFVIKAFGRLAWMSGSCRMNLNCWRTDLSSSKQRYSIDLLLLMCFLFWHNTLRPSILSRFPLLFLPIKWFACPPSFPSS